MRKILLATVITTFAFAPALSVDAWADDHGSKKMEQMKDTKDKAHKEMKEMEHKGEEMKSEKSKAAEKADEHAKDKAHPNAAVQ